MTLLLTPGLYRQPALPVRATGPLARGDVRALPRLCGARPGRGAGTRREPGALRDALRAAADAGFPLARRQGFLRERRRRSLCAAPDRQSAPRPPAHGGALDGTGLLPVAHDRPPPPARRHPGRDRFLGADRRGPDPRGWRPQPRSRHVGQRPHRRDPPQLARADRDGAGRRKRPAGAGAGLALRHRGQERAGVEPGQCRGHGGDGACSAYGGGHGPAPHPPCRAPGNLRASMRGASSASPRWSSASTCASTGGWSRASTGSPPIPSTAARSQRPCSASAARLHLDPPEAADLDGSCRLAVRGRLSAARRQRRADRDRGG